MEYKRAGGDTAAERDLARAPWRVRVAPSPRLIPLALAGLTFLVFSPSLWNDFVEWDDHVNLVENPSYRGLAWTQIRWMLTSTLMGHYIPLTWLSFGLDYTLWGMKPFGYHLTNTLLHAANAGLFYLLARRVIARATGWPASTVRTSSLLASLFFAWHPLRAESVAWVTERRDLLSGLFFFLTLLAYLRAADLPPGHRWRALLVAGSVASYAAALLSKSIVMTLPLVLILLDVHLLRRPPGFHEMRVGIGRAVLRKLPYIALGAAGAMISYWAVASQGYVTKGANASWIARLSIAGFSAAFYLEKTLVPVALSPLYELPASVDLLEPRFLVRVGAVVVVTAVLIAARRRWPTGLALWAYYLLALGPVSGIVHSGHQLAHDRYSYLSCLGLALLVGATAAVAPMAPTHGALRSATVAVATAWMFALAALTWYQVQTWRDTDTLWRHAAEADPACSICQHNIGVVLYRQKLFDLARERYERALALRPDRVRVHGNLGLALQSMGRDGEALHHIDIALDRHPGDPGLLTNKALVFLNRGAAADALPYLQRAHHIDPDFVPALVNLGRALVESGHRQQGIGHLARAREIKPGDALVRAELERAGLLERVPDGPTVVVPAPPTR